MSNRDIEAAQAYHAATKLSYINLGTKPPLYKSYASAPTVSLPTDFSLPEMPTLDAVATVHRPGRPSLDLASISGLLYFSAGLVKKTVFPSVGEVHFRAAASAGALYPAEIYLVCGDIPGLEAGVYHFSPVDFALRQLRKGDHRGELSAAAGGEQSIGDSPVTLICTAIFWRSAWKYRARSYRYCFWDTGTVLANVLAASAAETLSARVVTGFVDESVNRLLGIDGEKEGSICLVPIGCDDGPEPPPSPLAPMAVADDEETGRPAGEIDYPEVRDVHAMSQLSSEAEVTAWRGVLPSSPPLGHGVFHPLELAEESDAISTNLGEVILGRSSTRRFARESIPFPHLSTILARSTRGVPADFLGPGGESLLDIYLIANDVDSLPPGSYFFHRQRQGLETLGQGDFRAEAGHLCFEQALGADASAVLFLMADLGPVLGRYGNRGYRAAQLEAGIVGGKVYLGVYSLGLGATGLTFYDDDVSEFFAPHSAGKSVLFVVALGHTHQLNRVRPFRSRVAAVLDTMARSALKGPEG